MTPDQKVALARIEKLAIELCDALREQAQAIHAQAGAVNALAQAIWESNVEQADDESEQSPGLNQTERGTITPAAGK